MTRRKKQVAEATTLPSLTIDQTRELKLLRAKLQCSKGHRPWCWVASDGTHQAVSIPQITLWVQMIVRDALRVLVVLQLIHFLG